MSNGGIIGLKNAPALTSAVGVWNTKEQTRAQRDGLWPTKSYVKDGLLLYLDAGNSSSYPGSGSTWFDISGNNRNMTLYNGVGYTPANEGILDFDGVDDYGQIVNCGISTGANIPHTIEMWVNFDVITSTRWWLAVLGQYNTGAHHVIGTSPTGAQFGAWAASPQVSPILSGANNWQQICGAFNNSTLTYYVNGNSAATATGSGFNFANSNFTIGLRIGSENYYNGKVSITRIYNKALTEEEVQTNFNANRGRFGL
jgi:hypothetical protein